MCSSPAAEDLSIHGTLSSNSSDVVMVDMFYVKNHPGSNSQVGRTKTQTI